MRDKMFALQALAKIVYLQAKGHDMAQAMINFRMDSEEKRSLEEICEQLGISITSAFKIFAKKVIRERRIPFDVALDDSRSDPFWSEENQAWLRDSIRQAREGRLTEHELIEAD